MSADKTQDNVQMLDRIIADRVRSEAENAIATVQRSVHDAILAAMNNLVILRFELAIRLFNASSGHQQGSVVYDPRQKIVREVPEKRQ